MNIDKKILIALSFSALSLCTYQQEAWAASDDTDVQILNYIENQRQEARAKERDKDIREFKQQLDEAYQHDGIEPTGDKNAPIIFEGNDIMYNSVNGEVYGKGNVKITQNYSQMTTDEANGNMNAGDVHIPNGAHTMQVANPILNINSGKADYNYKEKTGVMNKVKGRIDNRYVDGAQVEFFPEYYIIYNGSITRCPAKVPDYAFAADKIEIYPDDHMVAYNARFMIKNKVIYQTDRYTTKIGKNSDGRGLYIPIRAKANNSDGISLSYDKDYPIADNVKLYTNLNYLSNEGMKNIYGARWENAGSTFRIEHGKYEDSDDNWLTREISYMYNYSRRIGNSPVRFSFNNEYGLWKEDGKASWHREHSLTLYHDPINLDADGKYKLFPSIGYKLVYEGLDESNYNSLYYDITALGELTDDLVVYTGYHYSRVSQENTLFNFGLNDYSKKVSAGFSYNIDDKNRIVVATGFDASDQLKLRDLDYYWYHDWHCVQTELLYEQKQNRWSIHFNFLNF